ncbi:hypothetical protein [Flavobacterium flavipallidum]|uniref:Uncharacterized protein n=1 Tax=Flavobacterium flavipallidum TaxID=3139140 RepID=A0ABU9HJ41_9FLAO
MKKIKSLIVPLLLIVSIIASCEDDGGKSKKNLTIGATPNLTKLSTSDQAINYIALKNEENIDLGFTVEPLYGNIASADIVGFYYTSEGVERKVFMSNVTEFPYTMHLDQNDLYDAFSIDNADDIQVSDRLIITTNLTLKDGRIIKMYSDEGVKNYGADVSNQSYYNPALTYIISCPLNDASQFNGNYEVVEDAWADYEPGEIVPLVYDSNFGLLKFKILNTNNPYIDNTDSYYIVTIDPSNSTVTLVSNVNLNYTGWLSLPVTGTGTVGSCTGDIILSMNFGPYEKYNFELKKVAN